MVIHPCLRRTINSRPSRLFHSGPNLHINLKSARFITSTTLNSGYEILFAEVERKFPTRWCRNGWYLTTAASLVASGQQTQIGRLYSYLTAKNEYQSSGSRRALVRRIREALIKCIILNGIPVVMQALQSLAHAERSEDQDDTFSRQGWQPNQANRERGLKVLETIFQDENEKIWQSFGSHRDIPWISVNISYGLFLADHSILNIQESELVILPAIACQNLPDATRWHLRGCLRLGMTTEEIEELQNVIKSIAATGDKELIVHDIKSINSSL